jgi:putative flippase GtrA
MGSAGREIEPVRSADVAEPAATTARSRASGGRRLMCAQINKVTRLYPHWYSRPLGLLRDGRVWRFSLVGVTGVTINSLALYVLHGRLGVPLVLASAMAVELAIVNNYMLNEIWTFSSRRPSLQRFAKFNLTALVALLVNVAVVWAMASMGVLYLVGNLFGIGAAMAINLTVSTTWALTADSPNLVTTIARFLALLELFREGAVAFEQAEALAELTVRWSGSDEGDVDVGDEFDEGDPAGLQPVPEGESPPAPTPEVPDESAPPEAGQEPAEGAAGEGASPEAAAGHAEREPGEWGAGAHPTAEEDAGREHNERESGE